MVPSTDSQNELVTALLATRYAMLASAIVLLYDYAICFDEEVDLIWKKAWSTLKAVYIWHRYFGILCVMIQLAVYFRGAVSDQICSFWYRWEAIGFSVAVCTSQLTVLLWIYVLYGKDLRVTVPMSCLLLGEVIAVFSIIGRSIKEIKVATNSLQEFGISSCAINTGQTPPPRFLLYYWIPILGYNAVVMILLLVKATEAISVARMQGRSTQLLDIYRNTVVNFAGIIIAYILCWIMWRVAKFRLLQIPIVLSFSLSITLANRLLLGLRRAYYTYTDESCLPQNRVRASKVYVEDDWMFELRELRWAR